MLKLLPLNTRAKDGRTVGAVEDKDGNAEGLLRVYDKSIKDGVPLIELPDGLTFAPTPETREREVDCIYVTGGSGAGKSTWCALYTKHFINAFKSKPEDIIIITNDSIEDPAYSFPHKHITIDDDMIANPITLEELTAPTGHSLVIFDDIEGVRAGKLLKAVEALTTSVLTMGRKHGINCIFISHRSASGNFTKNILNELNSVVWFPQLSTSRNLTYMLTKHLGMPEGLREALKDKGWGRWIRLMTKAPQIIQSEKRSAIYDYDECVTALKKKSIIDKKRHQMEAKDMLEIV